MINPNLLDINEHTGTGFARMIAFDGWRVALAHAAANDRCPEDLREWQQHNATDEVFCLLRGGCVLFIAGNGDQPGCIEAVGMEPLKLYNVRCGAWHARTLDIDSSVIIVENDNTSSDNSKSSAMSPEHHAVMIGLAQKIRGIIE
jgi:hypothetical protein